MVMRSNPARKCVQVSIFLKLSPKRSQFFFKNRFFFKNLELFFYFLPALLFYFLPPYFLPAFDWDHWRRDHCRSEGRRGMENKMSIVSDSQRFWNSSGLGWDADALCTECACGHRLSIISPSRQTRTQTSTLHLGVVRNDDRTHLSLTLSISLSLFSFFYRFFRLPHW